MKLPIILEFMLFLRYVQKYFSSHVKSWSWRKEKWPNSSKQMKEILKHREASVNLVQASCMIVIKALCCHLAAFLLFLTCYVTSVISDSWTVALQTLLSMGSPGKNTGVGCHSLLQGIFPTQGLNPHLLCLLHCQADSLSLVPPGKSLLFLGGR